MWLVGALGGLEEPEIRATFNGGLGMVVVVDAGGRAGAPGARCPRRSSSARWCRSRTLGGRYAEGPLLPRSLTAFLSGAVAAR